MRNSILITFLLISNICAAQNDYEYLPDYKGNWKPATTFEERFTPFKLTGDEKKTMLLKAANAVQMIKNFPSFDPPKGMQMEAITGMRYVQDFEKAQLKSTTPLPLELRIEMGDYIKYQGKIKVFPDKETYANISIFYNDPEAMLTDYALFSEHLYDQQGNQYYSEPSVLKTFDNAVIYNNYKMLFLQPGKKLWLQVTAKQYLETLIYHYSKLVKEGHTDNQMLVDNIQKELKNLQSEDQNKPAYFASQFGENLSNLSLSKGEGNSAIVKLNPDYFDKSKQRTAIQLLVVKVGFHSYIYDEPILKIDERNSNNQVQLYDFFAHFDFKRFQGLLD